MKLNKEELATGAVFGVAWFPFIGWWALVSMLSGALLWALGGSYSKIWRRTGCAAILEIVGIAAGMPIWAHVLIFWGAFGALSVGYGIPTIQPYDEGSTLGRFVFNELLPGTPNNHQAVERVRFRSSLIVRGLIGLLVGLAAFPLIWESGLAWMVSTMILVVGFPLMFAEAEGDLHV